MDDTLRASSVEETPTPAQLPPMVLLLITTMTLVASGRNRPMRRHRTVGWWTSIGLE